MQPDMYYEQLIRSISDQDVKRVGEIMLHYVGEDNAISLPMLAKAVFGEYNVNTERKTRICLERLATEHRIPIGAYSGKSGRWICADREEVERVIRDLEARKKALDERIRALRAAVVRETETTAVQTRLWW